MGPTTDRIIYVKERSLPKEYISTKEAAERFGYTGIYVGQLAREGKIKTMKVGRTRYVHEGELESYVENKKGEESGGSPVANSYISTKEAAERFGYTSIYIGQLAREGRIPSKKEGRTRYVDVRALEEYVENKGKIESVEVDSTPKTYVEGKDTQKIEVSSEKSVFEYSSEEDELLPLLKAFSFASLGEKEEEYSLDPTLSFDDSEQDTVFVTEVLSGYVHTLTTSPFFHKALALVTSLILVFAPYASIQTGLAASLLDQGIRSFAYVQQDLSSLKDSLTHTTTLAKKHITDTYNKGGLTHLITSSLQDSYTLIKAELEPSNLALNNYITDLQSDVNKITLGISTLVTDRSTQTYKDIAQAPQHLASVSSSQQASTLSSFPNFLARTVYEGLNTLFKKEEPQQRIFTYTDPLLPNQVLNPQLTQVEEEE